MDNLSHIAIAGTLGYALRRPARHIAVMAAAAVIPDCDWIVGWLAPTQYIEQYHGPTHSLLGAFALAALVAFVSLRYCKVASPWIPAFIGVATHLFFDGFTGFGEMLLWPFLNRRIGTPLVANYDGPTLAIIAVLMLVPAILNAVNREIGAKRVNGALAAWIALGLVLTLLPVRAMWRSRAYDRAHGQPLTEDPESVAVYPSAIWPWVFNAIEDTPIAYMVYEMDGWTGARRPFVTRFAKPQSNNLLESARDSPTGKAFLALAAIPFYSLEDGRKATMVRIRDLGFYSPGGSNRPFSVEIEVKSTREVVAERVNF